MVLVLQVALCRFVWMDDGALSVLIPGTPMMQLWSADNWDFPIQVCLSSHYILGQILLSPVII